MAGTGVGGFVVAAGGSVGATVAGGCVAAGGGGSVVAGGGGSVVAGGGCVVDVAGAGAPVCEGEGLGFDGLGVLEGRSVLIAVRKTGVIGVPVTSGVPIVFKSGQA